MSRSIGPPRVEQTRALLVVQTFVLLLGLLAVLLALPTVAKADISESASDLLLAVICTLAGAAAGTALAAALVSKGHLAGWVLALIAQLAVVAVVVEVTVLGVYLAIPAVVVLASAAWITINLLRPEVRAHFLRRRATR